MNKEALFYSQLDLTGLIKTDKRYRKQQESFAKFATMNERDAVKQRSIPVTVTTLRTINY